MGTDGMNPGELAKWMQEERDAFRTLTKVIKQHVAAIPDSNLGEWLHGLRSAFDRLEAHLKRNFDAQETGGYMQNLLELRPTMSREVDRLKHEHHELQHMSDRIRADLSETRAEDRLLVGDACARVLRFVAIVGQHEQRENTITLLVFNEELGAGE